ncbi:MAG: alpha/beta fold hydrolase [Candidatus Dormibacteraceae bacterium]
MPRAPRLRPGYLPVGRLVLHDIRGGWGRPPVVFLHGMGQSGILEWRYVLPAVARRRRVYAPDFPGFGFSQKPALRYGVPLFERTLVRYLDARGLKKVVLVGASMGGRVAIEAALRHPSRVARLILVDPLGFGLPHAPLLGLFGVPVLGDLAYTGMAGALLGMEPNRLRTLAARVGMPPDSLDDTRIDILRQVHADPGAGYAHTQTVRALALHGTDDVSARLAPLAPSLPIRLIWGAGDPIFPSSQGVRAQGLLPGSKLAIVEVARHAPQLERPETFLQALLHYLDD